MSKQEWSAIAIELLIVVLGVFICMQVQDWNSARQTRVRAPIGPSRRSR